MPTLGLDANTALAKSWFDKDVAKRLQELPDAERDAAALALPTAAVHGLGPGSQNTLAEALSKDVPTVRDYLQFMDRADAAALLTSAAQTRRVSASVVGRLYAKYNIVKDD